MSHIYVLASDQPFDAQSLSGQQQMDMKTLPTYLCFTNWRSKMSIGSAETNQTKA
jgi:hypothetical protein